MFGRKPRVPQTVADAIAQKKRLVFTCKACNTITSKEPNDVFYPQKMELTIVQQIAVCPECGAANMPGHSKQIIMTIEV